MDTSGKPKQPRKPLTPYMRYSKSVWQSVKESNVTMSVCEIGAVIGRMWRGLTDEEKKKYNDEFNEAKQQYDIEVAEYLRVTGLQPSDLVKPKKKKDKAPSSAAKNAAAPALALPGGAGSPLTMLPPGGLPMQGGGLPAELPSFQQMWAAGPNRQFPDLARMQPGFRAQGQQPAPSPAAASTPSPQQHLDTPGDPHWSWANGQPPRPADPQSTLASSASSTNGDSSNQSPDTKHDADCKMLADSTPSSHSIPTAHNIYNSYSTIPPWNAFPPGTVTSQAQEQQPNPAVFNKVVIMESEMTHLKNALSDKTREVQELTAALEKAYEIIKALQGTLGAAQTETPGSETQQSASPEEEKL